MEGNVVFTYLDVFAQDKAYVAELKAQYQAGGLGDVKLKRYLNEVIQAALAPIRKRRETYAKDPAAVYSILEKGSAKANQVAQQTLSEVRAAIGINYFG